MQDWIFWAMDRVEQIANQDPAFLESKAEHDAIVEDFENLVKSLPEEDRELLLSYMDVSGDLDLRRCQIAFQLGKSIAK